MNRPILSLAATLALVGGSHASVIFDDFEIYSPVYGDMNGQGGWVVLNGSPLVPLEGPIAIVDDLFTWPGSGLQAATVGGIQPTTAALTTMYHNASVPFVSVDPTPTSFRFETGYTESDVGNRNNFQFVLTTSAGLGNLLTINLTPNATPGQYDVAWTSGFFASGSIPSPVGAGFVTQFQLDTWADGPNVAYNFSNAGFSLSSGTLTGVVATDLITRFAVNWDSNSNGGFGNNSITIDNVSLVPEPTSAMLGLLGASFVFLRRRRA